MKTIIIALIFSVSGSFVPCAAENAPNTKMLFERFSRKEFLKDTNPRIKTISGGLQVPLISTGHTAALDSGDLVDFEVLMHQAEVIAADGIEAFDEVFTRLDDKQDYIRVIAFEALVRITNFRPEGYYFGRPGGAFVGNSKWCENARQSWKKWKAEQAAPRNR